MKALEKAVETLNTMSISGRRIGIDPRICLVVTLAYIGVVLSVPMLDPVRLIWMFAYPIFTAEMFGIGYARVFMRSLWVLPLTVLIGIFNPILDHQPCWTIGSLTLSQGWVSLISIIFRGLLSFQALLILVMSLGFYQVVKAVDRLGCPSVLTTQLMMLYRYTGVLLQEALTMHRAREARGFGRRSYPLRMWGTFVGQLLVRSLHRSRRIDAAMAARGFTGAFRWGNDLESPTLGSWCWLLVWCVLFAAMRWIDLTSIFNDLITRTL